MSEEGEEGKGEQLAPLLGTGKKYRSYTEDSLAHVGADGHDDLASGAQESRQSLPHSLPSPQASSAIFSWQMIFYANVFFACASFSLVLPSLWPYLQSIGPDWLATQTFLAWIVAAVGTRSLC